MAKIVEKFTLTVTLRDGETDHNRDDIINMIDKCITESVNNDIILGDSFQEEVLDDLISINIT